MATALQLLSVLRIGVGSIFWLKPDQAAVFSGLGPINQNCNAALMTRLFGIRDLVLAAGLLSSSHPEELVKLGLVVDLVDIVAVAIGLSNGLQNRAAIMFGGGAIVLASLGFFVLYTN